MADAGLVRPVGPVAMQHDPGGGLGDFGGQTAVLHQVDIVGLIVHDLGPMVREHNARATLARLGDQLAEDRVRTDVQAGPRLVENQQLRPRHHGLGQADLLRVALGERPQRRRRAADQREPFEQRVDHRQVVEPADPRHVLQVRAGAHPLPSREAVRQVPDRRAAVQGSGARRRDPRHDPQERRLAGTVRAENAQHPAGLDGEIDLLEDELPLAVPLTDSCEPQQAHATAAF